jgi:hypothetical protein
MRGSVGVVGREGGVVGVVDVGGGGVVVVVVVVGVVAGGGGGGCGCGGGGGATAWISWLTQDDSGLTAVK